MNTITITNGVLEVRSLDVTDETVVAYIDQLAPEARVGGAVRCLEVGARALTFAGDKTGAALLADTLKSSTESTRSLLTQLSKTTETSIGKSTETLERAVAQQLANLEKELATKLDPGNTASIIGKLRTTLLDDYREVAAALHKDFDLAHSESPLAALRSELYKEDERRYESISKQLNEILIQAAAKEAASAARSKSTLKGADFEAATEEFLTAESRPRKDLVRRTTTEFGLDQNRVGDFVVEVNPREAPGARVVIESKNGHKTTAELVRELEKAMGNRGAIFGISVVGDSNTVGEAIHPYGDDKLIVRVPMLLDNEWDFTALSIALQMARWMAVMGRLAAGSLDVSRVKADADAALQVANRFVEVKRRITNSQKQLREINEYIDDIKRNLETALQRVCDTISEAQPRPEAA